MKQFWLVVFYAVIASCSLRSEGEELARLEAPDGLFEAVFLRYPGSATIADRYELILVPTGQDIGEGQVVWAAEGVENLSLHWRRALGLKQDKGYFLDVVFESAEILVFTNRWALWTSRDEAYFVEIRLLPQKPSLWLDGLDSLFVPRPIVPGEIERSVRPEL